MFYIKQFKNQTDVELHFGTFSPGRKDLAVLFLPDDLRKLHQ